MKAKIAEWAKDKALKRMMIAGLALVLILAIGLCISIGIRAHIQKEYTNSVAQMEVEAYENMTAMTELFARIDDPNVDVRYKLLPMFKGHFQAVAAINDALAACDADLALLSGEQIAAFEAALEDYDEAYRTGSPTGLARADLAVCMEDVQAMVTLYNTPPEDEKDKVLIIDAASGKAIN